jgi:ribosomal protein S27E
MKKKKSLKRSLKCNRCGNKVTNLGEEAVSVTCSSCVSSPIKNQRKKILNESK